MSRQESMLERACQLFDASGYQIDTPIRIPQMPGLSVVGLRNPYMRVARNRDPSMYIPQMYVFCHSQPYQASRVSAVEGDFHRLGHKTAHLLDKERFLRWISHKTPYKESLKEYSADVKRSIIRGRSVESWLTQTSVHLPISYLDNRKSDGLIETFMMRFPWLDYSHTDQDHVVSRQSRAFLIAHVREIIPLGLVELYRPRNTPVAARFGFRSNPDMPY